jgi:hypothetical protein
VPPDEVDRSAIAVLVEGELRLDDPTCIDQDASGVLHKVGVAAVQETVDGSASPSRVDCQVHLERIADPAEGHERDLR